MKQTNLMLTLFLSMTFAQANEPDQVIDRLCETSVQESTQRGFYKKNTLHHLYDGLDHYYLSSRWRSGQKTYSLLTPRREIALNTQAKQVYDFTLGRDFLWLATERGLEQLSMAGSHLNTYRYYRDQGISKNRFRSLIYSSRTNSLIIAASSGGLITFDLTTLDFTEQHFLNTVNDNGHLSIAVALVQHEQTLYVAMSGNSKEGFNGFVIVDQASGQMTAQTPYDRRSAGVIGPHPRLTLDEHGRRLLINNGGWLHHYTLEQLARGAKLKLSWKPVVASTPSEPIKYAMLTGDIMLGNKRELLTCAIVRVKRRHSSREIPRGRAFRLPTP